jgi:predicted Zn-dependent protease
LISRDPRRVRRSQPQYGLAICSAHLGNEKEAREILGRLEAASRGRYVDASCIGSIYAALGQRDEAFAHLDRAVQDHSGKLPLIESNSTPCGPILATRNWSRASACLRRNADREGARDAGAARLR